MQEFVMKCVKCGGEYTQERGGGAKVLNAGHLCDDCLNPQPKPKMDKWVEPIIEHKRKNRKL